LTASGAAAVAACLACVGLSMPHIRWTAHFSGWVTQGAVFVIIIAQFMNSQKTCEFEDSPAGAYTRPLLGST
jgi:hypothetical protein